jgi:chromosome segregation ATPase
MAGGLDNIKMAKLAAKLEEAEREIEHLRALLHEARDEIARLRHEASE